MSRVHLPCPASDASDRPAAGEVLVREEPDEEDEEAEDDDKEAGDDDNGNGYSE